MDPGAVEHVHDLRTEEGTIQPGLNIDHRHGLAHTLDTVDNEGGGGIMNVTRARRSKTWPLWAVEALKAGRARHEARRAGHPDRLSAAAPSSTVYGLTSFPGSTAIVR